MSHCSQQPRQTHNNRSLPSQIEKKRHKKPTKAGQLKLKKGKTVKETDKGK